MSLLFNINELSNDFLPVMNSEFDKNDLKKITKELCRSYKNGMIPEDIFHEAIEQLLAFFIERSFSDKISLKNHNFDDKLFKSNTFWKY
ncbi:MAG: hypothetical protein V1793_11175 [Pseudomonadota bacterium]